MGCGDILAAVKADVAITQVIDQDDYNIGALGRLPLGCGPLSECQ
jgi:hypothetical protein